MRIFLLCTILLATVPGCILPPEGEPANVLRVENRFASSLFTVDFTAPGASTVRLMDRVRIEAWEAADVGGIASDEATFVFAVMSLGEMYHFAPIVETASDGVFFFAYEWDSATAGFVIHH